MFSNSSIDLLCVRVKPPSLIHVVCLILSQCQEPYHSQGYVAMSYGNTAQPLVYMERKLQQRRCTFEIDVLYAGQNVVFQ